MFRKALILPPFVLAAVGINKVLLGDLFGFFVWLFLAMILLIITLPIATDMDDKKTPVFQIVAISLLLISFFASAAFFDFEKAGFALAKSFFYATFFGIGIIVLIMIIKGKD